MPAACDLTPDDDDLGLGISQSSSSSVCPNPDACAPEVCPHIAALGCLRSWQFTAPHEALAKYGPEAILEVVVRLDLMISARQLERPRNPGAYLRVCLDSAIEHRAQGTPATQQSPPASELPPHLWEVWGGKEAAS